MASRETTRARVVGIRYEMRNCRGDGSVREHRCEEEDVYLTPKGWLGRSIVRLGLLSRVNPLVWSLFFDVERTGRARTVFRRYYRADGVEVDTWGETATPEECRQIEEQGGDPWQRAVRPEEGRIH